MATNLITGANQPTLNLSNVPISKNGNKYYCVVTNNYGEVTSTKATLTVNEAVINRPPTIQITSTVFAANEGETLSFITSVTGTEPISYQWYKNGVQISNATTKDYTTPILTAQDNGNEYYVMATNLVGEDSSNIITITVNSTVYTRDETNVLTAYDFDEGSGRYLNDKSGIEPLIRFSLASNSGGTAIPFINPRGAIFDKTYYLVSNGTNNDNSKTDRITDTQELALEFWIKNNGLNGTDSALAVFYAKTVSIGYRRLIVGTSGTKFGLLLRNGTASGNIYLSSENLVKNNILQHVVYSFDMTNKVVNLYLDSVLSFTYDISDISSIDLPYTYHEGIGGETFGTNYWSGEMYLMRMYEHTISEQQIINNYRAGF